jgi:hypothetical protein
MYAKLAYNHLGKTNFCAEKGLWINFYKFSHYVPLLIAFFPTQGYPSKVFGSHSYIYAIHWI